MRKLLLLAVPLLVAAGQANDPITDAAAALRRDPVYVHPDAPRALSEADADAIRDRIRESGEPVFVAVLPAVDRAPETVVRDLAGATGLAGTYAAVVGNSFRAVSSTVADAPAIATSAFQAASSQGTRAVIERFIAGVTSTAGAAPGSIARDEPEDSGGSSSLLPVLLVGAGGVGLYLWSRGRKRQAAETAAADAADVQILRAELAVLSDDVLRLEPEVALRPEAQNDYEAAVERTRIASAALDYADEPIDLIRVERVIAEARYAMSRAKAIVAGREPPEPPAELRRPGRHDEPPLDYDDARQPVYAGGMPFYGGGWFGGGGGLFSGLLLGSMLGGWGWGGGHDVIVNDYGDGGGWDGGGGDFGGGDWGGGDVGGGDW